MRSLLFFFRIGKGSSPLPGLPSDLGNNHCTEFSQISDVFNESRRHFIFFLSANYQSKGMVGSLT